VEHQHGNDDHARFVTSPLQGSGIAPPPPWPALRFGQGYPTPARWACAAEGMKMWIIESMRNSGNSGTGFTDIYRNSANYVIWPRIFGKATTPKECHQPLSGNSRPARKVPKGRKSIAGGEAFRPSPRCRRLHQQAPTGCLCEPRARPFGLSPGFAATLRGAPEGRLGFSAERHAQVQGAPLGLGVPGHRFPGLGPRPRPGLS